VNDPWPAFAAAADGAETAGFFERRGPGAADGSATFFRRAERTETLDPSSDVDALERSSARFLRGGRSRAVVGYVGFDAVGLFEPALRRFPTGAPFPLGELAYVADATTVRVPPRGIRTFRALRPPPRPLRDSGPLPRFGTSVRRLVAAIVAGEAFQVVLAHRREWPRPNDLLARAGRLRASEEFAFFYYLRFGDREIVGASPESVVELAGRSATVNPIAGTMPTGPGARALPLHRDPKELSEHRMLVDLARNDLGRVARTGSVRVLERERRVRYARLEHLVSRVGATVRPGIGPWGLLAATFPAGTVSGAPKIRATELLRAEERSWRGPYAGAVGCLRPGDRAEFALAIRTGFAAHRRLYTAAGAGIVHRSSPRREFRETLAKLAHVESVLAGDAR